MSRAVEARLRSMTGRIGRGGPIRVSVADRPIARQIAPTGTAPPGRGRFPRGRHPGPLRVVDEGLAR